ncbi:MAG: portal protein [Halothiobacillaceae bacterium]
MADDTMLVQALQRRLLALEMERATHETVWQDIQDLHTPYNGQVLDNSDPRHGGRRGSKMKSSVTYQAIRTMEAGMLSGMTSPAVPWLELALPDKSLMDRRRVRIWLEKCTERMLQKFGMTNFYPTLRWVYRHCPTFGTAALMPEEDPEDGFRLHPYPIGRFSVDIDHRDVVDTFAVTIDRTVKQLADRFGVDDLPERLRSEYLRGELGSRHTVHVLIEPNDAREEIRDIWGRPWRSVWWTKEGDILGTGGFDSFPVMVPRWETDPGMPYGVGIGHYSLSEAGQHMAARKDHVLLLAKAARPPLQGKGLQASEVKDFPGGWTNSPGMMSDGKIEALHDIRADQIAAAREGVLMTKEEIEDLWHVPLFRMLMNTRPSNATATEILQRSEERLLQVGPVLQSYDRGLLTPGTQWVFLHMMRNGEMPPPPPEVVGAPIIVNFVGPLAQAQKMVGIQAGERFLATIGNLSGAKPQVLDVLDEDTIGRGYADQLGIPADWLHSRDTVAQQRRIRAEQQRQQQAMEQGLAQAQGAKVLSETQVTDDQTMLQIMRGAG